MPGVSSQHAGRGGQVDEKFRAGEVDQEACQTVIVPELELTHRNRVVFIDNGQHTPLQQFRKGVAGIQKAPARAQIVAGQQHLRCGQSVGVKSLVPSPHQLPLTHGGPQPDEPPDPLSPQFARAWPGRRARRPRPLMKPAQGDGLRDQPRAVASRQLAGPDCPILLC